MNCFMLLFCANNCCDSQATYPQSQVSAGKGPVQIFAEDSPKTAEDSQNKELSMRVKVWGDNLMAAGIVSMAVAILAMFTFSIVTGHITLPAILLFSGMAEIGIGALLSMSE